MVFCCVPLCKADSWKCEPGVTFHEFPSSPDIAAKWIKQINSAVRLKQKPMWFPRGKSVICSKHFIETDFKDKYNTLKPRAIPTVFGYRKLDNQIHGQLPLSQVSVNRTSPFIVKVNKPTTSEPNLVISDVFSQASETEPIKLENVESTKAPQPLPSLSENKNSFLGALQYKNRAICEKLVQSIASMPVNQPTAAVNSTLKANSLEKNLVKNLQRKRIKKENGNELIEIGPNTFLKINPDIIKVNKKQTPSGNTVLQFLMDQKLASQSNDLMPKIVKGPLPDNNLLSVIDPNFETSVGKPASISSVAKQVNNKTSEAPKEDMVVQQVVGHLVDTHVYKESCAHFDDVGTDEDEPMDKDQSLLLSESEKDCNLMIVENNQTDLIQLSTPTYPERTDSRKNCQSQKQDVNFFSKAPVLFTTNLPLSHCLNDKAKTALLLKQKSRQVAALKQKITSMTKKIEELEDRCIVQERQLSYSFIKKLKNIRKNASKGEPCANYILEQIRCYTGSTKMRWSDTTLTQCAIWCRKAPYAYEYFKKADFFKLPCLGTVKRFMKKHPDVKFVNKKNLANPGESDSSSDFTFDDSDNEKEGNDKNSDTENEPSTACETVLSEDGTSVQISTISNGLGESSTVVPFSEEDCATKENNSAEIAQDPEKQIHLSSYPISFGGSTVEVQEIILPSGEVMQCYASNMCDGTESGNQYYIIPNVDQVPGVEQEYNIVQTNQSIPVILQNLDSGQQLPMQQDQLIFIANSTEQVECTETEISTA